MKQYLNAATGQRYVTGEQAARDVRHPWNYAPLAAELSAAAIGTVIHDTVSNQSFVVTNGEVVNVLS